jgi:hypothetical protein
MFVWQSCNFFCASEVQYPWSRSKAKDLAQDIGFMPFATECKRLTALIQ